MSSFNNLQDINQEIVARTERRRQRLSRMNQKDLRFATNPKLIDSIIEELCDRVALYGPKVEAYKVISRSPSIFIPSRSRQSWKHRFKLIGETICEELRSRGLKAQFSIETFDEGAYIDYISLMTIVELPDQD